MFLFRFFSFVLCGLFRVFFLLFLVFVCVNYSTETLAAVENYDWRAKADTVVEEGSYELKVGAIEVLDYLKGELESRL